MPFNIKNNPYASSPANSLQGGVSGASLGNQIAPGGIGAAVGAGVGLIAGGIQDRRNVRNQLNELQTGVNAMTTDPTGRPIYQVSDLQRAEGDLSQLHEAQGVRQRNKNIAVGMATSPVGGIIAAVGERKNRKLRGRKINELQQGIQSAQDQFNQANLSYSQNQLAQEQYYNQLNDPNRLYNLYRR
jgi:hypothetical protein